MIKTGKKSVISMCAVVSCLLFLCSWPYDPDQQPFPDTGTTSQNTASGILYSINIGQQTCNPSVSQDTVNYPGCVLWLGFSGQLVVNVPSSMTGYTTNNVQQHDRVTICDTSNTVQWYIMRDDIGVTGHIQDPEWGAHPDYIACLGEDVNGKWDGYVIRISDKASLRFCEDKMVINSTPHVWVSDTATVTGVVTNPTYNQTTGLISKDNIQQFFGTTDVKIVYTLEANGLTLYYIDYNQAVPSPVQLPKPSGKENWDCESPLISPEGNWITYNCAVDLRTNDSYIQRLKAGSTPRLIAEKAFEPHWWLHPIDPNHSYYVIYTTLTGTKVVFQDFTDQNVEKNSAAGTTVKQKLSGSAADVPAHMGLKVEGSSAPETIVNLPFKGGLSPDGLFLATGYISTYLLMLQ